MNVESRIVQKKMIIDSELGRILSGNDSPLVQAMKYSVLGGGKRYRPLLLLSTGEALGSSPEVALPFACAVELIHSYSLIHDDLPSMDNDDFRRGKPSCHKAFGEDIALLAGDALLTLAFEVLASAPLAKGAEAQKVHALAELSHSAGWQGMIGGQLLDITLTPDRISEETFHELIRKKTAALITVSVRVGAILGGADAFQMEAITAFGENIGLAFQTRDDLLDALDDTQKEDVFRPNSVSVFGLEGAMERLETFISEGLQALDRVGLGFEELRYLARKLLDVKDRVPNEQDS